MNENYYIKWSILLSFIILPHWIAFNLILKLNQNYRKCELISYAIIIIIY